MKEVVDLFEEEMIKEDKKELKKTLKEKKLEKKKEKKLEKFEDEEFAKMLKDEKKDNSGLNNIEVKKYTFLNIILYISIIILFLASSDYAIYNIIKGKDLEQILTSTALCITSVFYILSIIIKKQGIKKFFEILATLSIAAYMCYYLFIA